MSIKAGTCWINAHNLFDAAAGFGGYKESGFGRDGGKEGLYEYAKPAWQSRARPDVSAFNVDSYAVCGPVSTKEGLIFLFAAGLARRCPVSRSTRRPRKFTLTRRCPACCLSLRRPSIALTSSTSTVPRLAPTPRWLFFFFLF